MPLPVGRTRLSHLPSHEFNWSKGRGNMVPRCCMCLVEAAWSLHTVLLSKRLAASPGVGVLKGRARGHRRRWNFFLLFHEVKLGPESQTLIAICGWWAFVTLLSGLRSALAGRNLQWNNSVTKKPLGMVGSARVLGAGWALLGCAECCTWQTCSGEAVGGEDGALQQWSAWLVWLLGHISLAGEWENMDWSLRQLYLVRSDRTAGAASGFGSHQPAADNFTS